MRATAVFGEKTSFLMPVHLQKLRNLKSKSLWRLYDNMIIPNRLEFLHQEGAKSRFRNIVLNKESEQWTMSKCQ